MNNRKPAPTDLTPAQIYRKMMRQERDRNRKYKSHGKGRHLKSLDEAAADLEKEEGEQQWLTDEAAAVEAMIAEMDGELPTEADQRLNVLIAAALVSLLAPRALFTFHLILKNGPNRKESIWQLAKYHKPNARRSIKNTMRRVKNIKRTGKSSKSSLSQ